MISLLRQTRNYKDVSIENSVKVSPMISVYNRLTKKLITNYTIQDIHILCMIIIIIIMMYLFIHASTSLGFKVSSGLILDRKLTVFAKF